jgi:lysozyme
MEDSMSRVIGLDVSTYQDSPYSTQRIDFGKAVAAGAQFVIIRSSWSNVMDDDFPVSWANAQAAGIIRGAYHFWDYRYPALAQAEFFVELIEARGMAELPLAVDLEAYAPYGALPSAGAIHAALKVFFDVIERRTGRQGILYTNPSTLAYNMGTVPTWLLEHPLWLAHYINAESPTCKPWKTWTIWQYSAKGDGLKYGMESLNVDMNYFNGSEDELRAWAKLEAKPALTDAEKLKRLWDAHTELLIK